MDEIQRILVKVGRMDLAQKYYKKVADNSIKRWVKDLNINYKDKRKLMDYISNSFFPSKVNTKQIKEFVDDAMKKLKIKEKDK